MFLLSYTMLGVAVDLFWYLVFTKPKEEERAVLNLERQGYLCYLPRVTAERCSKSNLILKSEPLFPRYIFVQVPDHTHDASWVPIRSTLGVSNIVLFGGQPAKVSDELINTLKGLEEHSQEAPRELFTSGESVVITSGPFSGIEAVFKMKNGTERVVVLVTILSKTVPYQCSPDQIKKT